ncbi:hypothetical protein ONA91_34695 [Micromonospora sp. DR5-3]|uniref:hypothetical protein n=1 Tax=unclassified Micromonospora TaxID=2617518 RepID=UPI0011DBBC35|nr:MULTISPECIES: hypothetical protein [unclassified Micromonospora]MCW3819598.1 hypothetical protein [Micromonospora sp. DR5-3]TYC14248.1 hypothetical protein FXF52_39770 [Micromonospora sp. MP36]
MDDVLDEIVTDDARWSFIAGARFVGPDEWRDEAEAIVHRSLHISALVEGLADAADPEGQLINFRPDQFYPGALSDSLRNEHDPKGWKMAYDRFVAMVLMDAAYELTRRGLIAQRGNGGSFDYRLTLPAAE